MAINRVVIGSQAIKNTSKVSSWFDLFDNNKLAIALDAKITAEGTAYVAIDGWQQITAVTIEEILTTYQNVGVKHVLCTDINCDGTLKGPNFSLYRRLMQQFPTIEWQASGGIASLTDLIKDSVNLSYLGRY